MQPIVNGLEATYEAEIAFETINAQSTDGAVWFGQLGLPGHPGFVIFAADGTEVFRTFGVVDAAILERPLLELQR